VGTTPDEPGPLPAGTVTFLFTDIEGSTRLLQEAGDAYATLLEEHRRLLRNAFAVCGGHEVDTQGDSFFVAFATASAAVMAAVRGQRDLESHAWAAGRRVRVRMGLHTGEAITTRGGYVGLAVHRAARVAALAHGGQMLLTGATAALVADDLPDGTSLRDLGEHHLKDFDRPVPLFQLQVVGLRSEFPPLRTAGGNTRLPTFPGDFVGREPEITAIAGLLIQGQRRLVTVTGPGGIGKTRLAVEAARSVADAFPGGVAFVPLAAVLEPGLVLRTIAEAVRVRSEPGVELVAALAASLGDRRTLLVLDNFEQVAAASADLATLLDRIPGVTALVTSRNVLRLRHEQQYAVGPLSGPACLRLFADRARAVDPTFGSTDAHMSAVTEICRRLDGLPLAIELAAARVRLLPPEALLSRMDRHLDVLGAGPVDLPERQRTLRAVMDWSYGLLAPHEQALFRRLAVFAGGWTLQAAEAVCGRTDEPEVVDTLSELLANSLIVSPGEAGPEPRLHMLETVRTYAGEKLAAVPDRAETERRHTEWMLAMTSALWEARGHEYRVLVERFDRERPNLRVAVNRALEDGDTAAVALLARDAFGYLSQRDAEGEARSWVERALELPATGPTAVRGRLLVVWALAASIAGDTDRLRSRLDEVWRLLPDDEEHAFDQAAAAIAAIYEALARDPEEAPGLIQQAANRFGALGHRLGQAHVELAAGDLALSRGDTSGAEQHYRKLIAHAADMEDDSMKARGLSLLGLTLVIQGDLQAARGAIVDGARANLLGGQPTSMSSSLEGLAAVALADGRPDVAASALAAASAVRERIEHVLSPVLQPIVADLTSRARGELGDPEYEAVSAAGRSWQVREAVERTLDELVPQLIEPASPMIGADAPARR
jgi:predicted ATPase/class 3 adenylate cyclase